MSGVPLGGGVEFDLIREIIAAMGDAIGPVGDDTAAIPDGAGSLVVSTDASVEDVHFKLAWLSVEEIGWRAAASALSDLAAAAATPIGILAAVTVPHDAAPGATIELMRGVGAAARAVGARVLGGDLTAGSQWSIAITVFGRSARPMSRAGARPGDGIWVTGRLGGARAALESWLAGGQPVAAARSAFAHPVPRIAAARWLAERGATAMMDLSDGVAGDALHLAAASGVRLDIELERLPLHSAVARAADLVGESPGEFAAAGGEDYELLLTMPQEFSAAAQFNEEQGIALTQIGNVSSGGTACLTLRGQNLQVEGFRHRL